MDIKEDKLLEEAEILNTSQRLLELDLNPVVGNLDLENLKQIHKYIFQDIYPFAGKIREEDISKGAKLTTTRSMLASTKTGYHLHH